jgi:hypothetical protein
MASRATLESRVIVLTGLAVAGAAAGATGLGSDALLSRGFDHALEAPRPGLSLVATAKDASQGATAGDEGYWLTRAEVESPSPFAKPLAVGDQITIAGREGRERHLEVVDLKVIGRAPSRIQSALPMRLLLVTCRVTGETGERVDAPVRFIIEAEPEAPRVPAPAKAL